MTPETIAAGLAFFQGKRVARKVSSLHFQELPQFSIGITFDDFEEYTILPDLPWYRVALMDVGDKKYTPTVDSDKHEKSITESQYFIGWLTERVTYDPEQVGK